MPLAALAIPAIISGIGAVAPAIVGSNAAKDASAAQQQAAQQAGKLVTDTTAQVNPNILAAADKAGTGVVNAAGTGAANVTGTAGQAATDVSAAAGTANAFLNPFRQTGANATQTLDETMAQMNKTPTMADLQIDPGFAYRLQLAKDALANSAAARGGSVSGAALKQLDRVVQADVSQEYSNAFQRYQQQNQNVFNRLKALADSGQSAARDMGGNLIQTGEFGGQLKTGAQEFGAGLTTDAARFAGTAGMSAADLTGRNTIDASRIAADYLTQGANAKAAGDIGSANAWINGIGGITKAANAFAMGKLPGRSGTGSGEGIGAETWGLPLGVPGTADTGSGEI